EQMSTDETAAALGIAPGTVKSALHRALAQLRRDLQHRHPDSASTPAACTVSPPASRRSPG
ncbi:sigma factor-like helix-turn-helix DNA-binding protein, partial [Streptomyces sp. NPDC006476]|uniref:RNA polymerase sigma factor n=1 Tax=Streptomyces sp. NPDC006476 TaxID=3157175 RepID=UPI0033BB52A5